LIPNLTTWALAKGVGAVLGTVSYAGACRKWQVMASPAFPSLWVAFFPPPFALAIYLPLSLSQTAGARFSSQFSQRGFPFRRPNSA